MEDPKTINPSDQPHELCKYGCPINHIENCYSCFGFGFYRDSETGATHIVRAGFAIDIHESNTFSLYTFMTCTECGSDIMGWNYKEKNMDITIREFKQLKKELAEKIRVDYLKY